MSPTEIEVKNIDHLGIIAGIKSQELISSNSLVKNQVGKLTNRPTARWIFQGFQGIHLLIIKGVKQIVNLTKEKQSILKFFPIACQKYYILSG